MILSREDNGTTFANSTKRRRVSRFMSLLTKGVTLSTPTNTKYSPRNMDKDVNTIEVAIFHANRTVRFEEVLLEMSLQSKSLLEHSSVFGKPLHYCSVEDTTPKVDAAVVVLLEQKIDDTNIETCSWKRNTMTTLKT